MQKLKLLVLLFGLTLPGCLAFAADDLDFSTDGFLGLLALSQVNTTPLFVGVADGPSPPYSYASSNPIGGASAWSNAAVQIVVDIPGGSGFTKVAYGAGVFVAGNDTEYQLLLSTDGLAWSIVLPGFNSGNDVGFVTFKNNRFFASDGGGTGLISWSDNGYDWFWGYSANTIQLKGIAYTGSAYYAITHGNPFQVYTSADGTGTWIPISTSATAMIAQSMAYGRGEAVVLGGTGNGELSVDNFLTWTELDFPGGGTANDVVYIEQGNTGRFIASNSVAPFIVKRDVGGTWQSITGQAPATQVMGLAYSPSTGVLIAGGVSGFNFYYSLDYGDNWFDAGVVSIATGNVRSIAVSN